MLVGGVNFKSVLITLAVWRMEGHLVVWTAILLLTAHHVASEECPTKCQCKSQDVTCWDSQLLEIVGKLEAGTHRLTLVNALDAEIIQPSLFETVGGLKVTQLTIRSSSVKDIKPAAFQELDALEALDVGGNKINSIGASVFSGLDHLLSLNLSSNKLSSLGDALSSLPNLTTLDISGNFLQELPAGMFQVQTKLTRLCLDGNPLKNLKRHSFQGLGVLREFSARNCGLDHVDDAIFTAMPHLVIIDLGQNLLSRIPSPTVLSKSIFLKRMLLDNNLVQVLKQEQFANLHLQTLDLSSNRISEIDVLAFWKLSLRELDLSNNTLVGLNRAMLKPLANHLTKLNLAGNPLGELQPHLFIDLQLVMDLNLSSCSLDSVHVGMLKELPVLHQLDISNNCLHFLPQPLLSQLDRIRRINIHQNAWVCDCQIKPLRDWLVRVKSLSKLHCSRGLSSHLECIEPRCVAPSQLLDSQVSLLKDTQFRQCSEDDDSSSLPASTQGAIVASCMGFAVILLIITIFLWKRGKTGHNLKRACVPTDAASSHMIEDDSKIPPLEQCDRTSLTLSDHNFVFKHYFDHLVTDPKLMSRTSDSDDEAPSGQKERDSLYSSQPSLYSNHSAAFGVESTV